jgi:hypothetical protein
MSSIKPIIALFAAVAAIGAVSGCQADETSKQEEQLKTESADRTIGATTGGESGGQFNRQSDKN